MNMEMIIWVHGLYIYSLKVFEVEKNIKYTDFNKVRLKIEELTDKVAGKNKGIY